MAPAIIESALEIIKSQFLALKPSFFSKKPHFNFISIHYLFIIGLTILASILLFATGKGELKYIDALLIGGASNTQAGLNPVDVNLLNTFQQVVILACTMLSNPITINSCVVFLRLYWFEKRFQHVVREARNRRGTLSKAKSRAKNGDGELEKGVRGRNITVVHGGASGRITNDGIVLDPVDAKPDDLPNGKISDETVAADEDVDPRAIPIIKLESRRPEIKFADTVKISDGLGEDTVKLPPKRTVEENLAFLERQRNLGDEVLRIPGPRDAERGMLPERVMEVAETPIEPTNTFDRTVSMESTRDATEPISNRRSQAITIAEPRKPRRDDSPENELEEDARAAARVLSAFKLRIPRVFNKQDKRYHHQEDSFHMTPSGRPKRRPTLETIRTALSREKDELTPYLSWEPTLGRNSQFPGLSEEQREELGGIEYRSLKTLAVTLVCYFWGWWIFGAVCLIPWIWTQPFWGHFVDDAGQNKTWWGFFTANSAFMDLGYTLTPDSMNSFSTAIFPILLMAVLIVIGNTGFPVALRFMIWLISVITPRGTGLYEELRFLLDHPRRCFTLLFPSGATWWLFWLLVALNGIDLIFFIILDLGRSPVSARPVGIRILDGLFQAVSTRTAGFSCVNLAELHPAVQVSYMLMMYISVFPIAISVRRTNVYEENSLGMYNKHDLDDAGNTTDMQYVGSHLRRQLSFDLWYLFLGYFILMISEGSKLMDNEFSMFAVLFEVVSAYGTVGMSLGYSGGNASLCSQFTVVGKLTIVAMMIRGRHRGLPYGLDRAILLPSESLNAKEAADADARAARRASQVTLGHVPTRGRTRSRSGDRAGLITSFLHPGPAFPSEPAPLISRRSITDPNETDSRPIRRMDTVTTVHTTGRAP